MHIKPKSDHTYRLQLQWDGHGTPDYLHYNRNYRIRQEGKPDLMGSADPMFHGDGALPCPEDQFLAALSSCHMLSYLAHCARQGVNVLDYRDEAQGVLSFTETGGGHFTSVTLRPAVRVASPDQEALAMELHEKAHEDCFIASSCNFPVKHEATVTSEATASATTER